jgi:hypothetical protein
MAIYGANVGCPSCKALGHPNAKTQTNGVFYSFGSSHEHMDIAWTPTDVRLDYYSPMGNDDPNWSSSSSPSASPPPRSPAASRRSSAPSPPSRPAEVAHAADLHAGSPAVAAEAAPSPNPLPCSPRPTKAVLNEHESSHKVCSSFSISLICSSLIMYNHH